MDEVFFIEQVTSANARKFLRLTYSHNAQKLLQIDAQARIYAIGASIFGTAVGLVYAFKRPDQITGKVESLHVLKKYRKRGAGTRLLTMMEKTLLSAGCKKLELSYIKPSGAEERTAIEALLTKTQWDPPVKKNVIFRCRDGDIKHVPWLNIAAAFPSFQAVPWHELSAQELRQLQVSQAEQPWYPEELSPFIEDDLGAEVDAETSIGLRYQDRIIGWMITRRLPQNTLLFYRTFIREEFQQTGKGVILYAESIKRMLEQGYTQGIFSIEVSKPDLIKLLHKMLGAYVNETKIEYSTSKYL